MAKVIIEADTDTKTMKCSIDGKEMPGCESASVYVYNYEDESGDQCCQMECSLVQYNTVNDVRQVISNRVMSDGKKCSAEVAMASEFDGFTKEVLPANTVAKASISTELKAPKTLTELLSRVISKC